MFFLLFSYTEKSLLVNETNPGQKDKPLKKKKINPKRSH